MAVDVIAKAITKIEERLGELNEERQKLGRALERLDGATNGRSPSTPRSPKRRRRRARPGQRRQEILNAVKEQPGITISKVAKRIGTAPNPLYALARQLVKDGEIEKEGSGYRLAGSAVKRTRSSKKKRKAPPKKAKA